MIIYLLPYPFISLFFLFNCCLIDIFVAPSTCSTLQYSTVLYSSLVGRLLLGNRLPSVDFWSVGQTYILKFQILAGFRCFYSFCFIGLPSTQSKNLTLACQCAPTAGDRYELPEHLGCPMESFSAILLISISNQICLTNLNLSCC